MRIKILLFLISLLAASLCLGEERPPGVFHDPAESLLPWPVPLQAVYDPAMSDALSRIFTALYPEDNRKAMAYVLQQASEDVKRFYEEILPLELSRVTVDLASVRRRMGEGAASLNMDGAGKPLQGFGQGSILIFQPYYDFSTGTWSPDTLLVLSR